MRDELSARIGARQQREAQEGQESEAGKMIRKIEMDAATEVRKDSVEAMKGRFGEVIKFIQEEEGWVSLADFMKYRIENDEAFERGRPVLVNTKSKVTETTKMTSGQWRSSKAEDQEVRFKILEDISMYPDILAFFGERSFAEMYAPSRQDEDPKYWGDEGHHGKTWNFEDWRYFTNLKSLLKASEEGQFSFADQAEA